MAAPAQLSALAAIEERREEKLFPVAVDASGVIVSASEIDAASRSEVMQRVAIEADRVANDHRFDSAARDALDELLDSIRTSPQSAFDKLPSDLFFPEAGTHRASKTLPLDKGLEGSFDLTVTASTDGQGMLQYLMRDLVTRVGATRQHSVEEWSLAHMA